MNMQVKSLAAAVTFLWFATAGFSQEENKSPETPTPAVTDSRPPAAEPVAEEEDPGAKKTGHLQIEIHLANGRVISGVAMDGRMVERRGKDGEYRPLGDEYKKDVGSGVRVWYYDGLPGFLFVAWREVAEVRVVKELLVRDFDGYESRARAAEAARLKAAPKDSSAHNGDTLSRVNLPPAGFSALDDDQKVLIESFPPTSGFSPERYAELQRGIVVDGKKASPREEEWFAVYPEWLKAYRAFMSVPDTADPAARKAAAKTGGKAAKPAAKAPSPAKDGAGKESAPRRRAVESRNRASGAGNSGSTGSGSSTGVGSLNELLGGNGNDSSGSASTSRRPSGGSSSSSSSTPTRGIK